MNELELKPWHSQPISIPRQPTKRIFQFSALGRVFRVVLL
jgi:hypothetical protein